MMLPRFFLTMVFFFLPFTSGAPTPTTLGLYEPSLPSRHLLAIRDDDTTLLKRLWQRLNFSSRNAETSKSRSKCAFCSAHQSPTSRIQTHKSPARSEQLYWRGYNRPTRTQRSRLNNRATAQKPAAPTKRADAIAQQLYWRSGYNHPTRKRDASPSDALEARREPGKSGFSHHTTILALLL